MFFSPPYRITVLDYTYECPSLSKNLFISSTYRITGLNYTYKCPTLSVAYNCKLHLQNHRVTPHLWLRHLKCSLCLNALLTELLSYTTLTAVQP